MYGGNDLKSRYTWCLTKKFLHAKINKKDLKQYV